MEKWGGRQKGGAVRTKRQYNGTGDGEKTQREMETDKKIGRERNTQKQA